MDYLVIGLMIAVGFFFLSRLASKEENGHAAQLVIDKKQCPPHQWFWQEIVDQNGTKQGERIVCKVCGPLQSYNPPGANDGI